MNRIFQGIAHQTPFSRDMLIIDENRSVVILKPDRSEAVKNHSPNRFNWGYGESETAQLAPSILLEVTMVINEDVPLLLFSIWGFHRIASLREKRGARKHLWDGSMVLSSTW